MRCSSCGREVERRGNAQKYCRECARQRRREQQRRYIRKWLVKNRERHLEHRREYYRRNRERIRAQQAEWYGRNREREVERMRRYRVAHRLSLVRAETRRSHTFNRYGLGTFTDYYFDVIEDGRGNKRIKGALILEGKMK